MADKPVPAYIGTVPTLHGVLDVHVLHRGASEWPAGPAALDRVPVEWLVRLTYEKEGPLVHLYLPVEAVHVLGAMLQVAAAAVSQEVIRRAAR